VKSDFTHGDVQVPKAYERPATVVFTFGRSRRSFPAATVVPENAPVRSCTAVSHCR
jgi:hypothetical protein